jgi:HlyD family secretion protein
VTLELREIPEEIHTALRPGMSSTATITTDTKQNVLAVPLESIVEKAPTPAASPSATIAGNTPAPVVGWRQAEGAEGRYLIEANNKVRFIEVTTGITGEADIEITSGLNANRRSCVVQVAS